MPQADDHVRAKPRTPQQGRSKASFERMLVAAEQLMTDRGSDEFTLNDVAKVGKVSIGSIYCRFDSKDDLVHAVQVRVLERVDTDMIKQITAVGRNGLGLRHTVSALVDQIAEALRRFADVMRPFMLRANSDPVVASLGKSSYARTAEVARAVLLVNEDEIRHRDPEHAADAAFRMLYASLARYLGFGSSLDAAGEGDWTMLKHDLADMVFAYLSIELPRS